MRSDEGATIRADLRARLLAALDNEELGKTKVLPVLRPISDGGSWATLMGFIPLGVAALVLIALTLSAVFMTNGSSLDDGAKDASASVYLADMQAELMTVRDRLIHCRGSHDQDKLAEYAQKLGFDSGVRSYKKINGAKPPLFPVNVALGEVSGRKYRAVCFCSGFIDGGYDEALDKEFNTYLRRYVLFMIDGRVELNPGSDDALWVDTQATHTSVCWYEGDGELTCVAILAAGTDANKAREMVAPVALLSTVVSSQ